MELDEMKQLWMQIDRRLAAVENETQRMASDGDVKRRKTSLERLTARYRRFSIVGLLLVLMMVCYYFGHILPGEWGIWVTVAMGAMGAICAVMDYWLYTRLSEINIAEMSVSRVARIATDCRRRHLQFMCLTIPYAIVVVAGMAWCVRDNEAMLCGMLLGLILGMIVGIREFMRFMADYRALRDSD